jgi:hypothetical protein
MIDGGVVKSSHFGGFDEDDEGSEVGVYVLKDYAWWLLTMIFSSQLEKRVKPRLWLRL